MAAEQRRSKAMIKKEIIDFLNSTSGQIDPKLDTYSCGIIHRNCLVLATSAKDIPRATVLEFFNEGLTLYIFGEPGGKIANIKRNSHVSAVVYEQPLDHSRLQKSLQIFGKAELISVRNNAKLFRSKIKKWNMETVMKRIMFSMIREKNLSDEDAETFFKKGVESLNVIKLSPHHIILKEYHTDLSMKKYEWKK
jgi:nitroimidazol reductase NimA-like FMN-containing flavoprotein (pyridoxamine 5'-phosphate oxidase superfamily)